MKNFKAIIMGIILNPTILIMFVLGFIFELFFIPFKTVIELTRKLLKFLFIDLKKEKI